MCPAALDGIIPVEGLRPKFQGLVPSGQKKGTRENSMKVSAFTYTDYRKFLLDSFQARKSDTTGFNYLHICQETGINPGPSFPDFARQGEHRQRPCPEVCAALQLEKRGTQYFLTMVGFNQEKKYEKKMELFNHLISFRESSIYHVGPHMYKFYDKWYHSVIRALVEFFEVDDDFVSLPKMVVPSIRPDQAKSSITLLENLDLISRDKNGFFRPTQKSIDTGAGVTSVTLNNFILSMINLAREAMDRFPAKKGCIQA